MVTLSRRKLSSSHGALYTPVSGGGGGVNLLTAPKALDDVAWTKLGASINSNMTTDPDATSLADEMQENAGGPTEWHALQIVSKAASSLSYTAKVYAKAATGSRRLVVYVHDNAAANGCYAVFNIPGGAIGVNTGNVGAWSGGTATISSAGSGWFLCTIPTIVTDTGVTIGVDLQLDNGTGTGGLSNTYTGTAGLSLYLYNVQLTQP